MTEKTAAGTIEKIQEGAQTTMALVLSRLGDAVQLVREGSFNEALRRMAEAEVKLSNLAAAEHGLAGMADVYIMRAGEITAGMELQGVGIVQTVEELDGAEQVQFTFERHTDIAVHPSQELIVNKEPMES